MESFKPGCGSIQNQTILSTCCGHSDVVFFFLTSMYAAYLIGAAEIPRGRFRTTSHFYLFLGVGKKSQTVHNSGNYRLFLKVPNTYSTFFISCCFSSIEHLIESSIVSSRQDLGVSQKQKTEKKNKHIVICCLNVP